MPRAVLRRDRVIALLPNPISDSALEDALFASKAEVEAQDADSLTISATPDRLDLLSEGGLALHLQGVTGVASGIPRYAPARARRLVAEIEVDPSVDPVRPAIAGFVVRAPDDAGLDAGTLEEAVRFQELIHATVGRDRRAASLGIYPLDRLVPPFRYAAEPLDAVSFVPLDGSVEIPADRFFRDHPMAARYGPLGRSGNRCLTLRDAEGTILSLPPILNGRAGGEARPGDRRLFIESTGVRDRPVRESLGLLSVVFVARRWTVEPVAVRGPGPLAGDGRSIVTSHEIVLPSSTLQGLAGVRYPPAEVRRRLEQVRLSVRARSGGWCVEAPPWRPDLLTAVDAAEEVILAQALRPEDGIVPPSRTRGRRLPETLFRRRFASALLGLGFAAPFTSILVSEATVRRVPGATPIRLVNPVSAEFAYVRDRLLLSHMEVLGRNTRHGYPQRFAEVAPVIVRDASAEPGAATRYHAGAILAQEGAGFADAASLADYLLRTVDAGSVREPAEVPGTISGRSARVRVAGEPVGEVGEIRPEVLAGIGVPVPVAWMELDLTALGPLLGGPRATH